LNYSILWAVVIIITAVIELATVTMVSVWFTVGASAALLGHLCGFGFYNQIFLFILFSALTGLVSRPIAKKMLKSNITPTNTDALVGTYAYVTERMDANHAGTVKVKSREWRATPLDAASIEAGVMVEIMAIEGAHLICRELKEGEF